MNGISNVRFDVVSTRTIEPKKQKKYVAYKVVVQKVSDEDDPYPATLERRYNEFLTLYNGLKQEFPNHLNRLQFPRKAIVGNFKPEMILARSASFEALLSLIGSESQLRRSKSVVSFLQDKELHEALRLIKRGEYTEACPLIENSFRLMNKVETDRSPWVLRLLCLLVCVLWHSGNGRAGALAGLALRRYQAVSDADLLHYYVPLLHTAEDISTACGMDPTPIRDQLHRLKTAGFSIQKNRNLLALLVEDLSKEYDCEN